MSQKTTNKIEQKEEPKLSDKALSNLSELDLTLVTTSAYFKPEDGKTYMIHINEPTDLLSLDPSSLDPNDPLFGEPGVLGEDTGEGEGAENLEDTDGGDSESDSESSDNGGEEEEGDGGDSDSGDGGGDGE